jgi:UDP-N-acetylglucosamine 2-epimerase (non-hydrolysing)
MSEIMVVMGTRPEIMKNASIIESLDKKAKLTLVWSGQHYDPKLYDIFFEQFKLREPDHDLEVGSGTHSSQTAQILVKLEEIVTRLKPKIILAEGDTNTVVATALASAKLRIPFAHVESGMRSFDMSMPEEINRLIADRIAEILFAPTETAMLNLLFEGTLPTKMYRSGDTLIDAVLKFRQKLNTRVLDTLSLGKKSYGLVTVHRAENTENPQNLKNIMGALEKVAENTTLIFPMHPRTKECMSHYGYELNQKNIFIVPPLGYLEFLSVLEESLFVITDSGGVQEEAMTLNIPCITTRNNTEWAETLQAGGNFLTGVSRDGIVKTVSYVLVHNHDIRRKLAGHPNPLGDGSAGERICKLLLDKLNTLQSGQSMSSMDFRDSGYPRYMLLPGDPFEHLSVRQISEKWGVALTLIYDEQGKPIPPYLETLIRRGWSIRFWGPAKRIDSIIHYSEHLMHGRRNVITKEANRPKTVL